MRKRTKAREYALQILYQMEIRKEGCEGLIESFMERETGDEKSVMEFTRQLVKGTAENMKEIDAVITKYATNWQIDRMAVIDRNILRMAAFEILYLDDIPPKVSINEAVDMAKKYGDKDSGKFVNGLLDRINKMRAEG